MNDCQAGSPPSIDDGVACTDDSCDEVNDAIVNLANNGNCDDALFCNGSETCDAVNDCQAGSPPSIDDGVACTDDSCDEVNDAIVNLANNGNCDDALFCNGSETCDAVNDCQAGSPPSIDDGVACTDDSCDEVNDTIVNLANNANCDDALFCNGSETCDAVNDCQAGSPPSIDDGVACTDDSCDEVNDTIVNLANNANCDDTLFCNGSETCDAVNDCQAGSPPSIDDGVACTDDNCDEVNDVIVNTANNANCDDTLFCNGSETCDAVNDCQAGSPPSIDDGVACTDDSCDEVNDVIVNTANNANCDDTLFCNGSETCDAVNDCQAGTPPSTDDGVACTDDNCDEVNDVIVNTANDANCDDTDACTVDFCDAINDCQITGPPIDPDCSAVDVVVTEIMANPDFGVSDADGEWFEIVNFGTSDFVLTDCTIHDDGSNAHTITGTFVIQAGSAMTFARSANAGFTADYVYSGIFMDNGGPDEVAISCVNKELTRVNYDNGTLFPNTPTGATMALDPDHSTQLESHWGRYWCPGEGDYFNGNQGTPGFLNNECPEPFLFDLAGAQEVPPASSGRMGVCLARLMPGDPGLELRCQHDVANPTGAHIHRGPFGTNGGVVFPLSNPNSPTFDFFSLTSLQVIDLLNGDYYVNVHSSAFPGGEIRGQIIPAALADMTISGDEEVPPVATPHIGLCVEALTVGARVGAGILETWCTHNIDDPSAAHIHRAPFGANGGVVDPLSVFTTPILHSTAMDATLLGPLSIGELYINVHSATVPSGELRGQIPAMIAP